MRILLLLLFSFTFKLTYSQNANCIDSIEHYIYSSPDFVSSTDWSSQHYDKNGNLILNGETSNDNPNEPRFALIKTNSKNKPVWFETFPKNLFPYILNINVAFTNEENDIILSGYANKSFIGDGPERKGCLVKVDANGVMKWKNLYSGTNNTTASCNFTYSIKGKNDDIVSLTNEDDYNSYGICMLDNVGNVKWSRYYKNLSIPFFRRDADPSITFDGNNLILCGKFSYGISNNADGFFISRINYNNGNIIQTRSFSLSGDIKNTAIVKFSNINSINYDLSKKIFMIEGDIFSENIDQIVMLFDSVLNPVLAKRFTNNLGRPEQSINIDASNTLTIGNSYFPDTSFLYTVINNKLEILTQTKIKLSNNILADRSYKGDVSVKSNGVLNFQLNSLGSPVNKLLLFDASPFYNVSNLCLGYDTIICTKKDLYINPISVILDQAIDLPIIKESQLVDEGNNKTLSTEILCKEKSICDVIKLQGDTSYCQINSKAKFTINRNLQCLRETEWKIDSSAIEILNKNDSVLNVQFLKPYHGFIYAGFKGCDLKDSLKINVYKTSKPIDLGKDTIICPKKTIMLNAGSDYVNYLWQDGTTGKSYQAEQPGLYYVSASDGCGIVSTDTILIKSVDITLKADYSGILCKFDTAIINLPTNLYNYSLQPNENAIVSNNILKLFPLSNKLYTITGEIFKGCRISDTTLIKVEVCPDNIYFPNAFTPNNDGINDIFMPVIDRRPKFYEFIIYNKWGQTVFKTNKPNQGWDGYYKGYLQPSDVYVWLCKYQFIDAESISKKGNLILIK